MGKILDNPEKFFESMSDEEFENLLKDMGLNFTKVEPGEGGVLYKGRLYKTIRELDEAAGFKWSFEKCKECCYYDTDMYGADGCLYMNSYIDIKDGVCKDCKIKKMTLNQRLDILK